MVGLYLGTFVKIIEETSVFISTMISQTDATTLSTITTTTNPPQTGNHNRNSNSNHNNNNNNNNTYCHPSKSPISDGSNNTTNTTTSSHNGKNSKGFCNISKKRKRFEETIIDGFAINAFKTWEDLQDELNERMLSNISNNSVSNNNNNSIDNNGGNSIHETNCTADKKVSSKSKQKNSSTSAATNSDNSNILINNSTTHNPSQLKDGSAKKKEKAKKKLDAANPQLPNICIKDKQRNKFSSEKTTLKRALEAKELAEKRLSILQEKLKQEQSKNRINNNHDANLSNSKTKSSDHYSGPVQAPQTVNVMEGLNSHSGNDMLGHDLPREPHPVPPRAMPYSPFHVNSHLHKQNSFNMNQHPIQQLNTPPSPPRNNQPQPQQVHNHHQHMKHSAHIMQQHPQSPPIAPPPLASQQQSILHQQTQSNSQHQPPLPPPQPTLIQPQIPQSIHQSHSQYLQRHPQLSTPQPPLQAQSHPHILPPHLQSPMHPYSSQPPSSMMSSMGLGALPSPYSCPPSIYITDTISRQTSIIPPPIAPALDQAPPHAQTSRFGHSSVLQSITPYNLSPHHPMYYPTLPTERSFIEFARSYTGPGHLGYSNLMNPYPSPSQSSSITANPYSFDRWPRATASDHQRAVSRYNSLYQSTSALSDRSYPASYASTRPPPFPAGLFVSLTDKRYSFEPDLKLYI